MGLWVSGTGQDKAGPVQDKRKGVDGCGNHQKVLSILKSGLSFSYRNTWYIPIRQDIKTCCLIVLVPLAKTATVVVHCVLWHFWHAHFSCFLLNVEDKLFTCSLLYATTNTWVIFTLPVSGHNVTPDLCIKKNIQNTLFWLQWNISSEAFALFKNIFIFLPGLRYFLMLPKTDKKKQCVAV